jgi:hypothetical protein
MSASIWFLRSISFKALRSALRASLAVVVDVSVKVRLALTSLEFALMRAGSKANKERTFVVNFPLDIP